MTNNFENFVIKSASEEFLEPCKGCCLPNSVWRSNNTPDPGCLVCNGAQKIISLKSLFDIGLSLSIVQDKLSDMIGYDELEDGDMDDREVLGLVAEQLKNLTYILNACGHNLDEALRYEMKKAEKEQMDNDDEYVEIAYIKSYDVQKEPDLCDDKTKHRKVEIINTLPESPKPIRYRPEDEDLDLPYDFGPFDDTTGYLDIEWIGRLAD